MNWTTSSDDELDDALPELDDELLEVTPGT